MRKLIPALFLLLTVTGCNNTGSTENDKTPDTTVINTVAAIPETRTSVRSSPVVTYTEKVEDPYNDWKFEVALYETKRTFTYLARIRYKELRISDTFVVPDLGFSPKVSLQKGAASRTCIIGFLDKKGQFKEYRQVSVEQGDKLRFKTLKTYYAGHYRTEVK